MHVLQYYLDSPVRQLWWELLLPRSLMLLELHSFAVQGIILTFPLFPSLSPAQARISCSNLETGRVSPSLTGKSCRKCRKTIGAVLGAGIVLRYHELWFADKLPYPRYRCSTLFSRRHVDACFPLLRITRGRWCNKS